MSPETTAPSMKDFETPVEQTMDLPPLAILRVGDKADIVLAEVSVTKDDEGDERIYYRGALLADLECETKAKGETEYREVAFKKGEQVSIPGSGGLNFTLGRVANKLAGKAVNEKSITWSKIEGHRFVIERLEDEKMGKGKHKGKMVKSYSVAHSAPKSK